MSTKDIRIIFCENMKKLRLTNNLTKKQMAEILGVCIKTVTKIEDGKFPERLSVVVLLRAIDYFNVEADSLFES